MYYSCGQQSTAFLSLQAATEFALSCQQEDIRDIFDDRFFRWAHAVCGYSKATQIRSSALQLETEAYSDEINDGKYQLHMQGYTCIYIDITHLWIYYYRGLCTVGTAMLSSTVHHNESKETSGEHSLHPEDCSGEYVFPVHICQSYLHDFILFCSVAHHQLR